MSSIKTWLQEFSGLHAAYHYFCFAAINTIIVALLFGARGFLSFLLEMRMSTDLDNGSFVVICFMVGGALTAVHMIFSLLVGQVVLRVKHIPLLLYSYTLAGYPVFMLLKLSGATKMDNIFIASSSLIVIATVKVAEHFFLNAPRSKSAGAVH